jgi:hypothetical protein
LKNSRARSPMPLHVLSMNSGRKPRGSVVGCGSFVCDELGDHFAAFRCKRLQFASVGLASCGILDAREDVQSATVTVVAAGSYVCLCGKIWRTSNERRHRREVQLSKPHTRWVV